MLAAAASGVLPQPLPILIPAADRPEYLAQTLAALSAVVGINGTVLVFSQDGSDGAVARLIAGVDFAPVIHLRHAPPLAAALLPRSDAVTAANVRFLLGWAFDVARARGAIVLESDIELSPDALGYFSWALEALEANPALAARVLTVNGYGERSARGGDPAAFSRDAEGFMVWGWLCPAASWPRLLAGWTWWHNWDFAVEAARRAGGLVSLTPAVSRARHVGLRGINFRVAAGSPDAAKWTQHHIQPTAVDYTNLRVRLPSASGEPGERG